MAEGWHDQIIELADLVVDAVEPCIDDRPAVQLAASKIAKGDPRETLTRYRRFVADKVRSCGETIAPRVTPGFRRGDGRAEVISIDTSPSSECSTMIPGRVPVRRYFSVRRSVQPSPCLICP